MNISSAMSVARSSSLSRAGEGGARRKYDVQCKQLITCYFFSFFLFSFVHYIISKSDILEINCSSIALLEKCISQDTEPLQGAYDKI